MIICLYQTTSSFCLLLQHRLFKSTPEHNIMPSANKTQCNISETSHLSLIYQTVLAPVLILVEARTQPASTQIQTHLFVHIVLCGPNNYPT